MVADLLTITKKLKSSHPNLTNFIQILFQVNLNRMWDIWSFFFQLCPTFSFCWDICRFSFDYVPFLDFCGRFPRLFLHMSCFRISVGGFLAFFGICPTLGFLWEVSSPFFAYVPPFNTATKSLSDDTYLFINIPCI